jgi:hypothetical protein
MGPPPSSFVDDYFSRFNASAAHLWMMALPATTNAWMSLAGADARWVAWTTARGESAKNGRIIGGYPAAPPGRIGYQIGDEPTTLAELQEMELGAKRVRRADPNALLIINFGPEPDDIDELLDYFGACVDADIVSNDKYSYGASAYGHLERYRRVGLRYRLPYWRYLEAYRRPGEAKSFTTADMRWDAYAGLTYGYTGHTWFLYQIVPGRNLETVFFHTTGDFYSLKTALFDVAAQLNAEMVKLGPVITRLTSTDVRYLASIPLLQPEMTRPWEPGAGGDPYIAAIRTTGPRIYQDLLLGFYRDVRGEQYFMVQNVNHPHGDFPFWGSTKAAVEIDFDFSSKSQDLKKGAVQSLNPKTGKVGKRRLEKVPGKSKRRLKFTLRAGYAKLFKYKTDADFFPP